MTAAEAMLAALTEMTHREEVPPCSRDPEAWVSEDREQRAEAARRCAGCPVIEACAALADERRVRWGVWGGRDRSPRPTRARTR